MGLGDLGSFRWWWLAGAVCVALFLFFSFESLDWIVIFQLLAAILVLFVQAYPPLLARRGVRGGVIIFVLIAFFSRFFEWR